MSNTERSSRESKEALDRVESKLREAHRLYGREPEKAEEHAVAARAACDQMADYMSDGLAPLVNASVKSIEDRKPAGQVDIEIRSALAEVDNLRPSLGSVEE